MWVVRQPGLFWWVEHLASNPWEDSNCEEECCTWKPLYIWIIQNKPQQYHLSPSRLSQGGGTPQAATGLHRSLIHLGKEKNAYLKWLHLSGHLKPPALCSCSGIFCSPLVFSITWQHLVSRWGHRAERGSEQPGFGGWGKGSTQPSDPWCRGFSNSQHNNQQ